MATFTCTTCDGTGNIATGHRIGPCEWSRVESCTDCHGTGEVSPECDCCGDKPATQTLTTSLRTYHECDECMDDLRAIIAAKSAKVAA